MVGPPAENRDKFPAIHGSLENLAVTVNPARELPDGAETGVPRVLVRDSARPKGIDGGTLLAFCFDLGAGSEEERREDKECLDHGTRLRRGFWGFLITRVKCRGKGIREAVTGSGTTIVTLCPPLILLPQTHLAVRLPGRWTGTGRFHFSSAGYLEKGPGRTASRQPGSISCPVQISELRS